MITGKEVGHGFGSGNTTEIIINGDNLRTAEINDKDASYEDGRKEHIEGQRSRQLAGIYSFVFYTNLTR